MLTMMQQVEAELKATISSKQGGVPLKKINVEYRMLNGNDIPYRFLNYNCMEDFIRHVPGVQIKTVRGEAVLFCNNSISKMVENQRRKKTPRNINYRRRAYSSSSKTSRSDCASDDTRSYSSRSPERSPERQSKISITIDPWRKLKTIYEPIAYHQQMIGDDFFLQLAIRELRANNLWRRNEKAAIRSGLCISGQTIRKCIEELKNVNSISNRIVICLGAVDVYEHHSLEDMMEDLIELLTLCHTKFRLSKSAITLCTIPPLANVPLIANFDQISTLYTFNNNIRWIIDHKGYDGCPLGQGGIDNYGFIDFFEEFHRYDEDENKSINFDNFQIEARMVSGCPHPHVLWNKKGRVKAMNLLQSASTSRTDYYLYN